MAILFQVHGSAELQRFLGMAAAQSRNVEPALKNAGEEMLVRNHERLNRGVDVSGKPFVRSRRASRDGGRTLMQQGQLAASLNYATGRGMLELFSSDKRARVHYEGLTIVPKAGKKFLTIPLRARGGAFEDPGRGVASKANRTGARARHYGKTFFLRRGGRLFLMQKTGKGAVRALFLLVRSVKLPRREWMGFSSSDLDYITEVLGRRITGEQP